MKTQSNIRHSRLALAAMLALGSVTHAASLTWDADTGTIAAQDGDGTWSTTADWNTDGYGWWNGTTNANWTAGDIPTFGSGSGTAGNYTITLGGNLSIGGGTGVGTVLTFAAPGNYTFSAAATQTITIAHSDTATTNIQMAKGVTATIGDNVTLTRGSTNAGQITIYGGATSGSNDGGILVVGGGTIGNSVLTNAATNLFELRQGLTLDVKTGGTFTALGSVVMGASGVNSDITGYTNTLKISGGTVNVGATAANTNLVLGNNLNSANTSTGIATISDGALTLNATGKSGQKNGIRFGTTASNASYVTNGTFNLDGGVVTTALVYEGTASNGAVINSTFNFNGGELKVLSGAYSPSTFMTGLDTAQVRNGGAKINTNGVDTTIGQALVHSTITTPTPDNAIDGGLEKRGTGTLTLSGTNTYTGATTVAAGTLALSGSGSLANTTGIHLSVGTSTFDVSAKTGNFTLASTQTISGSGKVVIDSDSGFVANGTLSPGNSPGTTTVDGAGAFTLGANGNYNWQILDATGAAGTGYDTYNLTGGSYLDLASLTSSNPYNINLWSLSAISPADANGLATNFNYSNTYTWTLFSTGTAITGFTADLFDINVGATNGTGGFANAVAGFTVELADSDTDLVLKYTPVPEPTATALGLLAAGGLLLRRRRNA